MGGAALSPPQGASAGIKYFINLIIRQEEKGLLLNVNPFPKIVNFSKRGGGD